MRTNTLTPLGNGRLRSLRPTGIPAKFLLQTNTAPALSISIEKVANRGSRQ